MEDVTISDLRIKINGKFVWNLLLGKEEREGNTALGEMGHELWLARA